MSESFQDIWLNAGTEANSWARILKGFSSTLVAILSLVGAVGSVAAGIFIAIQSRAGDCTVDSEGIRSCDPTTYPHILIGAGVAAGGLLLYLPLYLLAVYMKASGWKIIYDLHRTWGR